MTVRTTRTAKSNKFKINKETGKFVQFIATHFLVHFSAVVA